MSSKDQVSSFFSGFFIGALIGAATALLLAPQSGEETRTQLREKGIELKETAEATYADVSQKAEAAYSDMVQQGKMSRLCWLIFSLGHNKRLFSYTY